MQQRYLGSSGLQDLAKPNSKNFITLVQTNCEKHSKWLKTRRCGFAGPATLWTILKNDWIYSCSNIKQAHFFQEQ